MSKKRLFTAKEYRDAVNLYRKEGEAVNDCLYRLCARYLGHDDRNGVHAKVWLIGRTYGTGIERQSKRERNTDGRQGRVLRRLSEYFLKKGKKIDALISKLKTLHDGPLDEEKLRTIAVTHGQFLDLICRFRLLREGRVPRAFASKYLHFHCRLVPILDSFAIKELRKHRLPNSRSSFRETPKGADQKYWRFATQFLELYKQAQAKTHLTKLPVKHLDEYLMAPAR